VAHISVEIEFSLLHKPQHSQCGNRLADGTSLKQGVRRYRLTAGFDNTESASPIHSPIVNASQAQTGNVILSHTIRHKTQRFLDLLWGW
jgi:hypothetical protein